MALRAKEQRHQYRGHQIETAPANEPVTPAELRTFLRADSTLLTDSEADTLIEIARQYIEQITGLAMIDQSWKLTLDAWPGWAEPWWDGVRSGTREMLTKAPRWVTLPRYPLSSITSVTTYDEDSNSTAITVANVFDVDTAQRPGRLTLQSGQTWPTALRPTNAIEIVYVAGFGSAASDVPSTLKRAITQMAGHLFEHRADCTPKNAYQMSGAAQMADSYSVKSL